MQTNNRNLFGALVAGATILIAGSCAATYVAPTGAPTATLVYRVEPARAPAGPSGFFRATTDNCRDLTLLSGFREGPPSSVVEADQRTILMTRVYTDTHRCYNVVSFTPAAGRTYTVTHTTPSPNQCTLNVVDEDQREPADLRQLPVIGNCVW